MQVCVDETSRGILPWIQHRNESEEVSEEAENVEYVCPAEVRKSIKFGI